MTDKPAPDKLATRHAAAGRRAHALALRTRGLDYGEIAASADPDGVAPLFRTVAAARNAVARALREASDDAETERRLQARRLDLALTGAWTKALGGDGPAIDRVLSIETRRARLLALDMPDSAPPDEGASVQEAAAEVGRKLQRLAELLAQRPAPVANGSAANGSVPNGAAVNGAAKSGHPADAAPEVRA